LAKQATRGRHPFRLTENKQFDPLFPFLSEVTPPKLPPIPTLSPSFKSTSRPSSKDAGISCSTYSGRDFSPPSEWRFCSSLLSKVYTQKLYNRDPPPLGLIKAAGTFYLPSPHSASGQEGPSSPKVTLQTIPTRSVLFILFPRRRNLIGSQPSPWLSPFCFSVFLFRTWPSYPTTAIQDFPPSLFSPIIYKRSSPPPDSRLVQIAKLRRFFYLKSPLPN